MRGTYGMIASDQFALAESHPCLPQSSSDTKVPLNSAARLHLGTTFGGGATTIASI
jgi:hypothetical protein